jgi:hypothetical protein
MLYEPLPRGRLPRKSIGTSRVELSIGFARLKGFLSDSVTSAEWHATLVRLLDDPTREHQRPATIVDYGRFLPVRLHTTKTRDGPSSERGAARILALLS